MSKSEKIIIFDTTLRDGEQSPGCSMNLEEKLKIFSTLEDLNVDIVEAGFAIASAGDFEAVKEISKVSKKTTICSLARANISDIDSLKSFNYDGYLFHEELSTDKDLFFTR